MCFWLCVFMMVICLVPLKGMFFRESFYYIIIMFTEQLNYEQRIHGYEFWMDQHRS